MINFALTISVRLHGPTPDLGKGTFSRVVFRNFHFPGLVVVAAAVAWRVVAACVDEDTRVVVRAGAFGRDDRSSPAAVVVVAAACNTAAVEHNIVVA